jgi:hypothetical protein
MRHEFAPPLQVAALMSGFERPWFVVGGWAIDLFLGRETRAHHDVEIGVFRDDQRALYHHLAGWQLSASIGKAWQPWQGEWIALPNHQIRARSDTAELPVFDAMLNERDGDLWRFRRNLAAARPVSACVLISSIGLPYLAPEVGLLFKAKAPRLKDQADFDNAIAWLGHERRAWLKHSVELCYPESPWLADEIAL